VALRERVEAPAIVLVGPVAALRDEIAWFPEVPAG